MKHPNVPYHGNPTDSHCALACYTMIGQYLLPNAGITFEMFGKLADYRPGYVVWAYPVWSWMLDCGIQIVNQDIIDQVAWAEQGSAGLKKSVSQEEFEYYKKNTHNLDAVSKQVKLVVEHPAFKAIKKQLSWDDIVDEFNKPGICDITLDGKLLGRESGFSIHRVVLLHIDDDEVVFHNPLVDDKGSFQKESVAHFRAAVESLSGPELCRYWTE